MKEKRATYQLIPLLLSFLVFVTSLGLTNNLVACYCHKKGEIKVNNPTSCCKKDIEQRDKSCCVSPSVKEQKENDSSSKCLKNNCCSSKKVLVQKDKVIPTIELEEVATQTPFLQPTTYNYYSYNISVEIETDFLPYKNYVQPFVYRDIPIFIQSFLL